MPAPEPDDPFAVQRWSPVPAQALPARFAPTMRPEHARRWAQLDVKDFLTLLDLVEQRPRELFNPRNWVRIAKRATDYYGHTRGAINDMLVRLNPYPRPFRRVAFPSADGTPLAGWLGLQPYPRPGLVIVPGIFSTKDDTVHKARAIRIWRRWNYNVLVIDLRGFGQSGAAPNTAGVMESDDVLAAVRYLHGFNTVTRIGVLAESLGGAATILAMARDNQGPRPLIACAACYSPFADAELAAKHLSTAPQKGDPFYPIHRLFHALLAYRSGGRFRDFAVYLDAAARHYGMEPQAMFARSQAREAVRQVKAPLLVLHAQDDATVPVAHARMLEDASKDMRNVGVYVLPWGHHCAFEVLDRRWYWTVAHYWFEQALETPWSGVAPVDVGASHPVRPGQWPAESFPGPSFL